MVTAAFLSLPALADADGGTTAIDFPGRLAAGSSIGAGLDPWAPGEIAHPSNSAALVVALRRAGAVLEGGSTSVAVQFNPYLLVLGEQQLYDEVVSARASLWRRLLQDSSVTAVMAPGTPSGPDASKATSGLGVSIELLGQRSIYGSTYSDCMKDSAEIAALIRRKPTQPRQPKQRDGEEDEAYEKRLAESGYPAKLTSYEKALGEIRSNITTQLERCSAMTVKNTSALFVTAGGRWVMPTAGTQNLPVMIDRASIAASFEFMSSLGVELTGQARFLNQRPAAGGPMQGTFDLGGSIRYSRSRFSLAFEVAQSVAFTSRGTATLAIEAPLGDDFAIIFGAAGTGADLASAFRTIVPSVSFAFQDVKSLQKIVPFGQ